MNTARIQEACRATGCRVLASTALIERIGALPLGVTGRSLGPVPMRDKEQSIGRCHTNLGRRGWGPEAR